MKKSLIFMLIFTITFSSIFFIPSEYNCARAEAAPKWEQTEEGEELLKKKIKRMKRVKPRGNPYLTGITAIAVGTDFFGLLDEEEVDQFLENTEIDLTTQPMYSDTYNKLLQGLFFEGASIGWHWITEDVANWISDRINEFTGNKINEGYLPDNGHKIPVVSSAFHEEARVYGNIVYWTPFYFTKLWNGGVKAGRIYVTRSCSTCQFYVFSLETSSSSSYYPFPSMRRDSRGYRDTEEEARERANEVYFNQLDNAEEISNVNEFIEKMVSTGRMTNPIDISHIMNGNVAIPITPTNFPYVDNAEIDSVGVTYFDNDPYLEYWVHNPKFDPNKPEDWKDNPRYIRYVSPLNPTPGHLPETPPEIIPLERPNPAYQPQPGEDPFPEGEPAPSPGRIWIPNPDIYPDPAPGTGPGPAPGPGPGPGPSPGPGEGPGPGPGPGPSPGSPPGTPGQNEDGDWECEKEYDGEKWTKIVQNISTRFPFSIPWDIGRAIDAFFGGMGNQKPTFEIPLFYKGKTATIEIPSFIDEWIGVARILMVFMFDIYIIYALRKFWGGQE